MKEEIALGADIGATNMKLVIEREGLIVGRKTFKTRVENGLESALENVVSFCCDHGIDPRTRNCSEKIVMGYSTPGIWGVVDGEETVLGNSFNLPWLVRSHLISRTKELLGIDDCSGLNDAKLQAFGQYSLGAGRGSKVMLCLTLGTGVGGAVVIDGLIFLGAHGHAGELGHITIDRGHHARQCNCGNKGCLEAYIGTAGFLKTVDEHISVLGPGELPIEDRKNIKRIFELAKQRPAENQSCWSAVKETAQHLAQGLSILLLAFNPDRVVFDGQISRDTDFFWQFAEEWLAKNLSQKQLLEKLVVVPSSDPEYSGAIGAAAYAKAIANHQRVVMSW